MSPKVSFDLPEKVKILGINGSPRIGGNTASMVKYTLEWAEKMGYAETEYVALADHKWYQCTGCMQCFGYMAPAQDPYQCYQFPDDGIKDIAPKIAGCDGLLLAFPVYTGGVPAIFRAFHEKLHHFAPMSFTQHAGALKYKAMAVISQGGQLYGGQEVTYYNLARMGISQGMFVAASWPTADAPMPQSTFSGGIITTIDGSTIYGKNAWRKEATRTVPPAQGSRNERTLKNLGRWLAVGAMRMKLGRLAFEAAGIEEPDLIPFTNYSVKPKKGSHVDKLMKEGRVTFVSQNDLQERKKVKS
ncbi:MAG: flavodoxin family protein [Desulfobacterales bacterium]|nr:flavodoxin family protein [Desulfobacterales bacterium]